MGNSNKAFRGSKRLFLALPISGKSSIVNARDTVKAELGNSVVRWSSLENLHLTLAFLGDVEEDVRFEIEQLLDEQLFWPNPFKLNVRSLGFFGSKAAKVVWLGVDADEALMELAARLHTQLNAFGFEFDTEKFLPHITLGRIKQWSSSINRQNIIEKYSGAFSHTLAMDEFVLYESVLKPTGAEYNVLKTYRF